jgi:hypothetical protein
MGEGGGRFLSGWLAGLGDSGWNSGTGTWIVWRVMEDEGWMDGG